MKYDYNKLISKYPNKIPIIINKYADSTLPQLDKHKFIVPKDITIAQFNYIIRKRIKLDPSESIFIYINNLLPPSSSTINELYDMHKSDDGFLYITYTNENTFG